MSEFFDAVISPTVAGSNSTCRIAAAPRSWRCNSFRREPESTKRCCPIRARGRPVRASSHSPSGRLALLSMFSGQSEEGYELFRLGPGITKVAGLRYRLGEAASSAFSPDEARLVMALPVQLFRMVDPLG